MAFGPSDLNSIPKGTSRALDLWTRLAHPKFGHCATYLRCARADVYAEVQAWHSALRIDLYTVDFVLDDLLPGAGLTCAYRVRRRVDMRPWRLRAPVTCVVLAKHSLGIDAPLVWTPRQLCALLEKMPEAERLHLGGEDGQDLNRQADRAPVAG